MIASTVVEPESLHLHPVTVRFGGGLELIGFRLTPGAGNLDLRTRWRLHQRLNDSLVAVFTGVGAITRAALAPDANQTAIGDDLLLSVRLNGAVPAAIELNVEDTRGRIMLPVCASSLPVTPEFTGVALPLDAAPAPELLHSIPWPALRLCLVVLHESITLVGYALERGGGMALLRLKWWIAASPERRLSLVAQIHASPNADAAPLASASLEITTGGVRSLEHSLIRTIGSGVDAPPSVSLQVSDGGRLWLPR